MFSGGRRKNSEGSSSSTGRSSSSSSWTHPYETAYYYRIEYLAPPIPKYIMSNRITSYKCHMTSHHITSHHITRHQHHTAPITPKRKKLTRIATKILTTNNSSSNDADEPISGTTPIPVEYNNKQQYLVLTHISDISTQTKTKSTTRLLGGPGTSTKNTTSALLSSVYS